MEIVLNSLQDLRVTLKNDQDFGVRLLEYADGFG